MKKLIFLLGIAMSFTVKADYSGDSINGDKTIHVYDETISRNGDIVKYSVGFTNNLIHTTETYDTAYNCSTHRDSRGFLAPDTLGRSAADYACDFKVSSKIAQVEPDFSKVIFPTQEDVTAWVKYNEYGMRLTATDSACFNADLKQAGYKYTMYSAIPLAKLKKADDAYKTDDQFATTVAGCWNPDGHKFIAVRKHDNKILHDENFHIDDTWTKVENSYQGVKS